MADGDLFYHLNDPTGASLVLADETGAAAGRMVYDGYGGVLSNTLPLTLSGSLAGHPDAATGLVHRGDGRWYDPTLGRPLQPNPAGGPPAAPQALNRYAATPVGQPGVYQGAANDGFNRIPSAVSFSYGLTTQLIEEYGRSVTLHRTGYGLIEATASRSALTRNFRSLPGSVKRYFTEPAFAFHLLLLRMDVIFTHGAALCRQPIAVWRICIGRRMRSLHL